MITIFKDTILGTIGITAEDEFIIKVEFSNESKDNRGVPNNLINEAFRQLDFYFNRKLKNFDLPLKLNVNSSFHNKVLKFITTVPYGKTCSYKQISEEIGATKAYRAVGLALNRNPLPIFIPCHRVIGSDGSLVGYAGGLNIKRMLLNIESGLNNNLKYSSFVNEILTK